MMGPGLRRFFLTSHVTSSVGWLGAVAGFLALAVVGLVARDVQTVRAACLGMAPMTRWVIVPLCLASLVSGIVQSLGTPWGLFKHHWVLLKLVVTLVATAALIQHAGPIQDAASLATAAGFSPAELGNLRVNLVVDAGAALLALVAMTALSIYKPRAPTSYGRRRKRARRPPLERNPSAAFTAS